MEQIEKAVYELMAVYHVSEEAESAQKDANEQLYREAALKKQIDFLQKQLDEMHPENISDVRRFETKIKESEMNEEAKKEAETDMSTGCSMIIWILSRVLTGSRRRCRILI